ncbi:alpha/beta-hydrolase [Backusella circina FSU 941]|nr:alpha/beta-hydrolase [Backusella circina FSU 941]
MAIFQSSTLFVSISLFCLPLIILCAVLCLPFLICVVSQTDAEFNLPYSPTKILKVNYVKLSHLLGWLSYLPRIAHYLYWRYWQLGSERFKQIVSVDIPYSNKSSVCKLDVYYPEKTPDDSAPVIIFIYGGSWSSGSKFLYTAFANTLRELGYVVVVPDYRKYPQVKVDSMYHDVRETIKWTFKHAAEIGGDPELIYVMGHSAGAHLTSQVVLSDLIEQAKYQELNQVKDSVYHVSKKHDPSIGKVDDHLTKGSDKQHDFLPQVEGILLFAGVYDIKSHLEHEKKRGIDKISAMGRAMGSSAEGYLSNSPIHLIENGAQLFAESEYLLDSLPRILILHGQKDTIVNMEQSSNMFNTIGKAIPLPHRKEVDVRMRLHKRMGHSEPVLALMPSLFSKSPLRKSLLRDIQEFIDLPPFDDDF